MERDDKAVQRYAEFVARMAEKEQILPFDRSAVAAVVEQGVRLAGRQNKLSTRFSDVADVIRESGFWAHEGGSEVVRQQHVDRAVGERIDRLSLMETKIRELIRDGILMIDIDGDRVGQLNGLSVYDLGDYRFGNPTKIKSVMGGLSSDVIACVVKLMSNEDLIAIGAKAFNPLPGSRIGARGYLGARIQPNSPTDNVDDIRWQVFDGWAYAVGDVVLGTNPVSSEPRSVEAIQQTLQDLLVTFEVDEAMRIACCHTSTYKPKSNGNGPAAPRCGFKASPAATRATRPSTSAWKRC